jgi:hypothetical protein
MLLNVYLVFYIILWLSGIANRIAEVMGNEVYILQVLQASTQLIGFAGALARGWNEQIGKHRAASLRAVIGSRGRERGAERWIID